MSQLLIIGTVWPEPTSTAAGSRMMQIIEQFQNNKFEVVFASTAAIGEFSFDLKSVNVRMVAIELNNASFDDFIIDLKPEIVIFDRFMIEEQFGWRIAENLPNSIRILDTEDLHFVRNTRFDNYKLGKKTVDADYLLSDLAKREIASIYRCDISLIISEVEMQILISVFNINPKILCYLPFLIDQFTENNSRSFPSFAERQHFITIGNFRHEPNWNAVLYLKQIIWPLIKKQLPFAEMHVYGSYITQKASELHNENQGFFIKGRAENAINVIKNAKVLLAPIRFGAGIKGKLIDAMQAGTPTVTTTIGAEGINGNLYWNGCITDDPTDFSLQAVALYEQEDLWQVAQKNGYLILNERFDKNIHGTLFMNKLIEIRNNIDYHRAENFIGAMLQINTLKSAKYMSKWIELKNNLNQN